MRSCASLLWASLFKIIPDRWLLHGYIKVTASLIGYEEYVTAMDICVGSENVLKNFTVFYGKFPTQPILWVVSSRLAL